MDSLAYMFMLSLLLLRKLGSLFKLNFKVPTFLLIVFQYYLKTGTCKFGATCKFHHPRDKAGVAGRVLLNVLGYPLRPVCCVKFRLCAYLLLELCKAQFIFSTVEREGVCLLPTNWTV